MAKVKNISGEDRTVPGLGGRLVLAGQVVEVPDDEVYAYTQQTSTWAPADEPAKAKHAEEWAVYHEVAELEGNLEQPPQPPAGNAGRDEWVAYVLAAGLATPDAVDGMGRDELRDTYGPKDVI